jgi:hypothetical protein
MGTNGDSAFSELIAELTPLQLDWLSYRIDSRSDREASRQARINKDTPARWKAEGVPLDDIVEAAKQDGVILVKRRIEADLNWAYDVKRGGLKSKSETIQQNVSSEILDRGIGKATQRQQVDVTSKGKQLTGGHSDEERTRALVSLYEALRDTVLAGREGGQGAVVAAEQSPVPSTREPGG